MGRPQVEAALAGILESASKQASRHISTAAELLWRAGQNNGIDMENGCPIG